MVGRWGCCRECRNAEETPLPQDLPETLEGRLSKPNPQTGLMQTDPCDCKAMGARDSRFKARGRNIGEAQLTISASHVPSDEVFVFHRHQALRFM